MSGDLPTELFIDGHLRQWAAQGGTYYILQKGSYSGGTILLKLDDMQGNIRLLTQMRNMDGMLAWVSALRSETPSEEETRTYIERARQRDPDLWVIEVEDKELRNPFMS